MPSCDAGSYQDETNASSCKLCDAGDFCPAGASLKLAPTCTPGTYANMSEADGEPECFECNPGFECAGGGRPPARCRPDFAAESKMKECAACEAGSISPRRTLLRVSHARKDRIASGLASAAAAQLAHTEMLPIWVVQMRASSVLPGVPAIGINGSGLVRSGSFAAANRSSRCTLCGEGYSRAMKVRQNACVACQEASVRLGRVSSCQPTVSLARMPTHRMLMGWSALDCDPGFSCSRWRSRPVPCTQGHHANASRSLGRATLARAGANSRASNATGRLPCESGSGGAV